MFDLGGVVGGKKRILPSLNFCWGCLCDIRRFKIHRISENPHGVRRKAPCQHLPPFFFIFFFCQLSLVLVKSRQM